MPARGPGPFPKGGERSPAPLLPGTRLLPAAGPQRPACSWGNDSLAEFHSFLVAASSQIDCELHRCVTCFKLSPNALCEHVSASGPVAICLLRLSGRARAAALSSACPQEANGDVLVLGGLGWEVCSPPASSRLSGSCGGDAQEPLRSPPVAHSRPRCSAAACPRPCHPLCETCPRRLAATPAAGARPAVSARR